MHKSIFISCVRQNLLDSDFNQISAPDSILDAGATIVAYVGDNGYYGSNQQSQYFTTAPTSSKLTALKGPVPPLTNDPLLSSDYSTLFQAFYAHEFNRDIVDAYSNGELRWQTSDHDYQFGSFSNWFIQQTKTDNCGVLDQEGQRECYRNYQTAVQELNAGLCPSGYEQSTNAFIPINNPDTAITLDGEVGVLTDWQIAEAGWVQQDINDGYFDPQFWREGYDNDFSRNDISPELAEYFFLDIKSNSEPKWDAENVAGILEGENLLLSDEQEAWLINSVLAADTRGTKAKIVVSDKPIHWFAASAGEGDGQDDGFGIATDQRDRIVAALLNVDGLVFIGGDEHTSTVWNKTNGLACVCIPSLQSSARPSGNANDLQTDPVQQADGLIYCRKDFGYVELNIDPVDGIDLYYIDYYGGNKYGHFHMDFDSNRFDQPTVENQPIGFKYTSLTDGGTILVEQGDTYSTKKEAIDAKMTSISSQYSGVDYNESSTGITTTVSYPSGVVNGDGKTNYTFNVAAQKDGEPETKVSMTIRLHVLETNEMTVLDETELVSGEDEVGGEQSYGYNDGVPAFGTLSVSTFGGQLITRILSNSVADSFYIRMDQDFALPEDYFDEVEILDATGTTSLKTYLQEDAAYSDGTTNPKGCQWTWADDGFSLADATTYVIRLKQFASTDDDEGSVSQPISESIDSSLSDPIDYSI